MPNYILHINMDATHYVCWDILQDCSFLWTLPTMYAGIFYKTALFTQCLIIHITSRRALTTMYVLMCYKTALFSECLFTHAYKGAHHSVHVDVL